ncbi:MAG: efflux RND transporter permease subunit [Rhodospirillales bacterium]|nr:efflux RND transporter permease subunit [Rhodospirillales bacterium]
MHAFIDAAIDRSRTILSTLVLILIAGSVAYQVIPKEANPDVNIPIIYVSMTHDGISPEDAERLLIRPMEQELRVIEGLKELRAVGYEGGANIIMEFEAGFDADAALTDTREKVDVAKPELPEDTDEPEVHEVNFSLFPIIVVALSGNVPERTMLKIARDLKDELEGISTVLKVEIAGDRDELVEIVIDPVHVESYGLSPIDAVAAVRKSNLLVAAGAQDTGQGRFSIKVPGLFETVRDIASMPIVTQGDSVIVLGDIAEIRRGFKDAESFARIDGKPALALEITKRTGENVIGTIEHVRAVVEIERAAWPVDLRNLISVSYLQDQSEEIRTMLTDLQNNVISAVLLVMIVVVAALGLRTALLVGIAIPGSFLMAILVLYSVGVTINVVVLFSLILAVGMLVDGAIVVTEYADRKMMEGEPRSRAYGLAAKRMAWPIIASTATTLAAFLPLVFWPGVVGEFMKFLPMTLLITLSGSLLMALVFVPTLGSHIGAPGGGGEVVAKGVAGAGDEHGDLSSVTGITGTYLDILRQALRHPGKILIASAVMLAVVQMTYAQFGRGIEFFPKVEPEFAKLQVRARGNLSIYEQNDLIREVEARILDITEFSSIYSRTGKSEQSEESEDIIGTITLEFVDWDKRRTAVEILAEVRQRTEDLAGIKIDRRKEEAGPPVGKAVQVELSSRDPSLLEAAVAHVLSGFYAVGGFVNIEDSAPLPGIDWELRVNRAQASKFGVDVDMIGRAVQMATTGVKLGEYRPNDADDEIDIRARYPSKYRTIEQLDSIRIASASGAVPVTNFVERIARQKVGTINRTDARRIMSVKSDVEEGLLVDDQVRMLAAWLVENPPAYGVDYAFKGENEEQRKAQEFLGRAFSIALFIMAIILVTQFNSFYSALLILSAVIMSTIGVFIGLLVMQQPFGIVMSGIGVIALAGIVVNNNIVLIDTFDRLRESEPTILDAILRTGAQRLRPVLLTTVTTVLGLMPMVLGINIDFLTREVNIGAPSTQWWQQLSTAIVFGLVFSTVLTLVVTPCSLMIRHNFMLWRHRNRQKTRPAEI